MPGTSLHIEQVLFDIMCDPAAAVDHSLHLRSAEDWSALIGLAQQHRCAAYLAHLHVQQFDQPLPHRLRAVRERNVRRALQIARECQTISAILAEAGIAHVFLKGVPLAFRDYPAPWTRPMRDIDVLVEPDRAEQAHALLRAAGGELPGYANAPVALLAHGKHLPPVQSPNRVLPVEVHYRITAPAEGLEPAGLAFLDREIWRDRATVRVGGADLPVPAAEVLLAHLVIHGIFDHELNNGPLFMTDLIHLLQGNRLDQPRWVELVDRIGLHGAVALAGSLLPAPLQAELAGAWPATASLPRDTARRLMLQPVDGRSQVKLRATLADAAPAGRLTLVVRKLFPGGSTLRKRWQIETEGEKAAPGTARLWLWYIARKARQNLAPRSVSEDQAVIGLRDLRQRLKDGSHLS